MAETKNVLSLLKDEEIGFRTAPYISVIRYWKPILNMEGYLDMRKRQVWDRQLTARAGKMVRLVLDQ